MRLSLFAVAALLTSSLAAHADTIGTLPLNGSFQNGSTVSGSITVDDTTGTALSGNLSVNTGSMTLLFGPTALGQFTFYSFDTTVFNFNDPQGDTLALAVLGDGVFSTSSFCTVQASCDGILSALVSSGAGLTFLQSTTPASVTPEPSSIILLATGLLGIAGTLKRRFA